MPRTPGAKNIATRVREAIERGEAPPAVTEVGGKKVLAKTTVLKPKEDKRTDAEVVATTQSRFEAMADMMRLGLSGRGRGAIFSGAPGIGKSFNLLRMLNENKAKTGHRFAYVKGKISPIALYRVAYEHSAPGEVILMDDADSIFFDDGGLNLLKALMDTSEERTVSWYTARTEEKSGDDETDTSEKLPSSFIYRGFCAFITNLDFQTYIDADIKQYVEHMKALMDRAHYLTLKIHTPREVIAWVRHIAKTSGLFAGVGIDAVTEAKMMKWIEEHHGAMRFTSLRTAIKMADYYKSNPNNWEERSGQYLLRD